MLCYDLNLRCNERVLVASSEVQSHTVEGEVGGTKGPFPFGFKVCTYLPEFSLKIQLCMCMHTCVLFEGAGNKRSKSILEEPIVLDKLSICAHQCVKVSRDAQVCPSILRVVVAFLHQCSSGTGKKKKLGI